MVAGAQLPVSGCSLQVRAPPPVDLEPYATDFCTTPEIQTIISN
jgi:hypothetical protein